MRDLEDSRVCDVDQFVHVFVNEGQAVSDHCEIVDHILSQALPLIGCESAAVIRAKANLLIKNQLFPEDGYHPPHIDLPDPDTVSMIYYVDTVDGDTVVFDKTAQQGIENLAVAHAQTPQENSLLVFPSNQFHASSSPRTANRRVVNIVARQLK